MNPVWYRWSQTIMFDLDRFIADLRAALAERSRQALKEVVARAVADPASLLRQIGQPGKGRG
jgi:phosphoglycolate phosphatase-like HAD superfamily hydrolase